MNDKTLLAIVGMLCITVLDLVFMLKFNIDGAVLVTIASIIAGVSGYKLGQQTYENLVRKLNSENAELIKRCKEMSN
ncbi:hypothetical protein G4O51_12510 [Candidatus Bathyarchaeota archaeon A05DMB-2]|nr:hypothetical protein [Candidatus Bathyarchaeota archaeon A05DMB-2]